MSGKAPSYLETKAGPTFVRDGKAFVRTRDGALSQVDPGGAQQLFESGEYLPASAEDVSRADIKAANSTLGAKAKTFAESAAAGAIDAAQAPIALPLRANAALWGDKDPLEGLGGRAVVESAATIFGNLKGGPKTGEAYGREYGENARARAEENPGAALAGNVAGTLVTGGALSGGAGAIGKTAAGALGGGALARAGGAVATGALEGAAYGQAQATEEAYLHNIPLTGEKLIAAMGWGAVLGGGVSLAAHGAGALLRRGSRGATPIDGPRLPTQADEPLDVAASGFPESGTRPVAGASSDVDLVNKRGIENTEFNRDPASMRDMRVHRGAYEGATPEEVQQIARGEIPTKNSSRPFDPVSVNIEADGQIHLNDGRHRLQAAKEAGADEILAKVRRYDSEGNIVAEEVAPVSIGATAATEAAEAAPSKYSSGLRDFADERTAKALGARGSTLKKLGRTAEQAESTMHDMARTVRGVTLEDGSPVFRALDSQEELAARVRLAKEETTGKLQAFRDKAEKVFESHPEIAPRAESIADRIKAEVADPLASHPSSAIAAQAAPIQQLVNDVRALSHTPFEAVAGADGRKIVQPKGGDPVTSIRELTRLRQGLDDQIYQAKRGVNLTQQGAPPALKDLQRARMILEESIEAANDKAATFFEDKAAQSYKEVKTQWRHLNLADEIAGAAQLQDLGNRVVSPSDYGVGAAAGMLGGGPVGAVASAFAHKTIREHSSAVLAVLADKLANNLDGKIESGLGAFFRESTARAAASTAGLDRAASAVPLKRIVTPAAVDAFTGKAKDLQSAYERRVAELTDASRDMGAGVRASMLTAMGGGADAMPRLTQAATLTATKGAQYLESQLPSGTAAPTVFQPTRKISPSDLQIREFAQKWSAVANPLSVIDDLRRGTVTHAQIDALKAVYPELYAEVQVKALEKIRVLDEQGKRMPFNDRLQLDLFLDLNGAGEPTLSGKFIDRVAGMQAAKAKQDAQPKLPNSGAALSKIGVSRQSGAQGTFGG
jgi:hypothetical protein